MIVPSPRPSLDARPSVSRAFGVLVVQSLQRHWRVRQMGWVSLGLLGLVVGWVFVWTHNPFGWKYSGWDLPDSPVRRGYPTYRAQAEMELLPGRYDPRRYDQKTPPQFSKFEAPSPFDPTRNSIQTLILSIPHAILRSERFVKDWGYMNFSRWVVLTTFLGFVLPLFTLSYASAAFGTERESRSLIWLMTRPIPRSGIYLAKLLGTLPWCLLFGVGGFAAMCWAGGEYGRMALVMYWPIAIAGTVALTAFFHLIGAVFRRPVVVGLIYVFFFEALVALLPGSIKLLSLTFYARSLMYNAASAGGYPVDLLDQPNAITAVSSTTAWTVLVLAPLLLTMLGMWLFARSDYRDDV
jgi:ABC-type transport system involved in multi-copper enzyme maturation permease subunit